MTNLYANSPRADLVRKRDSLVATIQNLGRVQYRFTELTGDEQIALTDAMVATSADLRDVRAAIARIDSTIMPLVPEIDVFDLSLIAR